MEQEKYTLTSRGSKTKIFGKLLEEGKEFYTEVTESTEGAEKREETKPGALRNLTTEVSGTSSGASCTRQRVVECHF